MKSCSTYKCSFIRGIFTLKFKPLKMQIPFYYSLKDFETNYQTDLSDWLIEFPDADEKDFLSELKNIYFPFITGSFPNFSFTEPVLEGSHISESDYPSYFESMITHLAPIVEKNIIIYLNKSGILNDENPNDYIFSDDEISPLDYWDDSNDGRIYYKSYSNILFDDKLLFSHLKYFFNYFFGLHFDEKKYKNFSFAVVKIATFIESKYSNKKSNIKISTKKEITEQIETPLDKDAKVKFILLKEIGIIDFLNMDKNLNNTDIAKILKPISGIPESYIKNILTADLHRPDPISDKSAYKKKNIQKALFELSKMGISIEQCKYLPTLKINSPELFD